MPKARQSASATALRNFLKRRVQERLKRAWRGFKAVRRRPDPKATHALSTALRRLLVCDLVLRELYGRPLPGNLKKSLKPFRRRLGDLRDALEIEKLFLSLRLRHAFAREYTAALRRRRRKIRGRLSRELARLAKGFWGRLLRRPGGRDPFRGGGQARLSVARLLQNLLRQVLELYDRAIPGRDDVLLHQMRIRYKRFRYAVELLAPDFSSATPEDLTYLRSLQQALGQAHDWLVLDEDARNFAADCRASGVEATLRLIASRRRAAHRQARRFISRELHRLAARGLPSTPRARA